MPPNARGKDFVYGQKSSMFSLDSTGKIYNFEVGISHAQNWRKVKIGLEEPWLVVLVVGKVQEMSLRPNPDEQYWEAMEGDAFRPKPWLMVLGERMSDVFRSNHQWMKSSYAGTKTKQSLKRGVGKGRRCLWAQTPMHERYPLRCSRCCWGVVVVKEVAMAEPSHGVNRIDNDACCR